MKTKTIIQIVILAILVIILIISFTGANVKNLNSNEFEQLISSEEVFVINTHTPYMGEIAETDLIAEDWQNMESYLSQLPADKSTPIAVYCRSGSMSAVSAQQLLELGYTNIYDLSGGMNAWQESGKNLIDNRDFTGEIKEFNLTADDWEFTPNQIIVNQGDKVILHIESEDEYHGIYISTYNINKQLPPGEVVDIEFIADKKGTFNFFCNVPCGAGHSSMGGQLIVN